MATKLKNLNVKKVDFVDEGANQQADIKLFKRKDGEGEPSTQKEPALKRFIAAFAKMAGLYDEAMGEISQNSDVTVEKGNSQTFGEKMTEVKRQKVADEMWSICYALQSSLQSILYDDDLDGSTAQSMMEEKATYNNVKYKPMGDPQEHETSDSYGITITVTEIVIEDIDMFRELMASMKSGTTPQFVFQGVLQGLNGSEERVVYRECIPSGDIDLQNVANGDVIKRNWNFFVNGKPDLQKELSI